MLLIVDDEQIVRETASRMARALGYTVIAAASAAEALDHFARVRDQLDGLLCDIAMPERDGPSIAAELRHMRPNLPVLFMSGYLAYGTESPLPDAFFLQKPFTKAELADKLTIALAGKSEKPD